MFLRGYLVYPYIYIQMDYVIAIPTHGRPDILRKKTLNFLQREGISKHLIYIYIAEEEIPSYRPDELLGYNVVAGKLGKINQQNKIQDDFPVGQNIVFLDDDVESWDNTLSNQFCNSTLNQFFQEAFQKCINVGATLWSVYPVWNAFFRKNQAETTYCLNYMVGAFFGLINTEHRLVGIDVKDDMYRSIQYFIKDGILVRFNKIGFKTKYYGTTGGLGTFQYRIEPAKFACADIQNKYPEYGTVRTRKNGMTEFVLKKIPATKVIPETLIQVLPEIPAEELGDLYQMLSEMSISHKPANSRHRFPKHRAQIFGYTLLRIHKKGEGREAISRYTKLYPHIYAELLRIGKKYVSIPFNSIYVNHNVTCPAHKDSNNVGKSCLLSFGEYTGGNIVIEGVKYDANCRGIIFNGGELEHWNTDDLVGNKYSLVFYQTNIKSE